jgi:hypothetical protein
VGSILLTTLSITLAYWLNESSFYIAGAVILVAVIALLVQSKRSTPLKQITITNLRIGINESEISLSELAGFWLENTGDGLVINLENKQPTFLPVSFFFANQETETAKKVMIQILPELEPRSSHFTDKLTQYFRI